MINLEPVSQLTPSSHRNVTFGHVQGVLCALMLMLCVLAARPFAEIGMEDDWSYFETTRVLAATGHIVYNGWATAMLGWQLYWGALFIKLFGPTYASVRFSNLLLSAAAIYLFHHILLKIGIRRELALLGTLLLALDPMYMSLSFSCMTDNAGLLCILLAFYACLRATESPHDVAAIRWLVIAAGAGIAGGTVRQIAWLAALVMLPSAVWLLRSRRRVVLAGALLWLISLIAVLACLTWFAHQPYSVPEKLIPHTSLGESSPKFVIVGLARMLLEMPLFLLPLMILFVPLFPTRSRRSVLAVVAFGVLALALGVFEARHGKLGVWITPYLHNYVAPRGLVDVPEILGNRPVVLGLGLRVALTLLSLGSGAAFAAYALSNRRGRLDETPQPRTPWLTLLVLIVPFSLAYTCLLVPRAFIQGLLDRYVLIFIAFGILLMLLYLQQYVDSARLHRWLPAAWAVVLLFALFGIAGVHDLFSEYRGLIAATDEVRAAGVPRTAIGGGFEYDTMTEIAVSGYVNDPRIETPAGAYHKPLVSRENRPCSSDNADNIPHVVPRFVLSFDPNACLGPSSFAPVLYSDWLLRRPVPIYILNAGVPPSGPASTLSR